MPPSPGLPVLVVDPSPWFRQAVRTLLIRSRRFRLVGEATTVAEATVLAAQLRPGLVVLDVHLPDGSGVAAGLWIRRLLPPPLVLLASTYGEVDLPDEVRRSGLPYVDKAEFSESTLGTLLPATPRGEGSRSACR